jgi:predicted amidohydrolase YtcJ
MSHCTTRMTSAVVALHASPLRNEAGNDQAPSALTESAPPTSLPATESEQSEKRRTIRSTAPASSAPSGAHARPAARLFTNADFLTLGPSLPLARALLARHGLVVATGEPDELRHLAPDAELIDLGGHFACPGFVDAHNHFSLTALAPREVDCRTPPVRSMADLFDRVRAAVATSPPGRFIRGHGYDDAALGGRHPTRAELDEAAPHHPVVLVHWTVHRCVANSAALRLAGIPLDAEDPPGGWLVRDLQGTLTGLCYERATDPLQSASLASYVRHYGDELPALFRANAAMQLREGITAGGDAYVHPSLVHTYGEADLAIAVRPFLGSTHGLFAPPNDVLGSAPLSRAAARSEGDGGPGEGAAPTGSLFPHGVKVFVDGGGNTTAASLASGRPPRFLFYRQDELDALVAAAHGRRLPVAVHAAGDIAVTMALDAFAHARRAHPAVEPRFRIEHAITLKQQDIPRLRDLSVVVVTQPEAVYLAGERLAAAGLAEGVRVAPFRDMLDAGVRLAFSSDSPCYALPPLFQMWCAVVRATRSGAALNDGQAVTADEALTAYIRGGAAALFATEGLGVLSPGLRADFAVLSADPRATPLDRWRDLRVERVFVGGAEQHLGDGEELPPGRPVVGW